MDADLPTSIRTDPCSNCVLCGEEGLPLYKGLRDQLFGVNGTWEMSRCVRGDCGLVWLNPKPLAEDIHHAYARYSTHTDAPSVPVSGFRSWLRGFGQDYLAWRYDYPARRNRFFTTIIGKLVSLHPTAGAALDLTVFHLHHRTDGRLLEIGCGSGQMLAAMGARGWHVEGIDADPVAVCNALSKGLHVKLGTLEQQNYPHDSFDAIVMCHVIEHVYNPVDLVRECYRLLKPDGTLVMVTPNASSWGHHIYQESWRGLEPPRHLHIFNPCSMRRLAKIVGIDIHTISTTPRDANNLFLASERIRRISAGQCSKPAWFSAHRAKLMQLVEWVLLKSRPEFGEDMVFIARKPVMQ